MLNAGFLAGLIFPAIFLSSETLLSIIIGAAITIIVAYIIYMTQKKETIIHKQDHDAKLERIEQLHLQDSEKIKVLYELIIKSQSGGLGEIESAVLEQKIEVAAEQITEQDSDHAQVLKAIAEKDKDEADDLLDKMAKQEHDLAETYKLRAMNENRNGFYAEAVKWYRKMLELEPDNFEAKLSLISSLNQADLGQEARQLASNLLDSLDKKDAAFSKKYYRLLTRIIGSFNMEFELRQMEPYILQLKEMVEQNWGGQSLKMGLVYNELGRLYSYKNNNKESEEYYLKSLAISESNQETVEGIWVTKNNLAGLYSRIGRYPEALVLLEQVYQIISAAYGDEHPSLTYPLFYMAKIYTELGKLKEAETCYLQAKKVILNKFGANHEHYTVLLQALASLYRDIQRYEESDTITRELLEQKTARYGAESLPVASLLNQLGVNLSMQKKTDEAEDVLNRALQIYAKLTTPEDNCVIIARYNMAYLYFDRGDFEKALQEWQDLLALLYTQKKDETKEVATMHVMLARTYTKLDQWAEAEQHMQKSIGFYEEKTPDDPRIANLQKLYAEILSKLGRQAEADQYTAKAEEINARLSTEEQPLQAEAPA